MGIEWMLMTILGMLGAIGLVLMVAVLLLWRDMGIEDPEKIFSKEELEEIDQFGFGGKK